MRFYPALRDGRPVAVWCRQRFKFGRDGARRRRDETHRALDGGDIGVVFANVGAEDGDERKLLGVERVGLGDAT